jgi:hypothetical protein
VENCYSHTEKLPQDFKIICLTHTKGYQLVSRPSLGPHQRCTRVRLRCRRTQRLFVNYSVRREYLSLGHTDSTSTTPCTATTHLPVARVLHQLCRAPRLLVSQLHGLYLTHCLTARLLVGRASGHCVSRRDYSSSGLHQLCCAYVVHPDAPSRCSTSRQSVALALAVCPVIPLCVVTTHLTAAMNILRLRHTSGCLGMSRGSSSTTSPTPRVRVPRHVARLVVDYFASAAHSGASACCVARRRLLCLARLVVDYFTYAARPGASAHHAARNATRRAARRRLLRLA